MPETAIHVELITLGGYLVVLLVLGALFSRYNRNISDFARGGGQGTWWMVGTSMFMAGISAFTFTGNASAAFLAGPSLLVIYFANCIGLALCAWIGPWFRQTRATTWADIMRERFSGGVEQFSAVFALLIQPVSAATQLYALSVFASAILGLPTSWIILLLGLIVMGYSTTGGRWAVMATDFVQGIILFVLTLLMCGLALREIGGFSAFLDYFQQPEFQEDFRWVKAPGQFPDGKFTWKWMIMIFILQLQGYINLGTAGRFLSVKDGRHARRAAWWACFLMAIGTVVWFIPPMVARFLFEAEIMALEVKEPATASYAFLAQKLLPNGMMGFMLAAMLAATMSSMDTGLNNTTGVVVNNILPALRRRAGLEPLSDRVQVRACRLSTVLLGFYIILIGFLLARQQELALFDAYLMISAVVGLPLGMPVLLGLWIKKLHWAAYYIIIGFALVPSTFFVVQSTVGGETWAIQDRLIWIYLFSAIGCLVSLPLWRMAGEDYRIRVKEFYRRMHTPIDYATEVGEGNDRFQYLSIGWVTLVLGLLMSAFVLLPNPASARWQIMMVGCGIALIGGLFLFLSRRQTENQD
jgi:SSS family transporter